MHSNNKSNHTRWPSGRPALLVFRFAAFDAGKNRKAAHAFARSPERSRRATATQAPSRQRISATKQSVSG